MPSAMPPEARSDERLLAEIATRMFAGRLDLAGSLHAIIHGAVRVLGADRATCYVPAEDGTVAEVHTTETDPRVVERLMRARDLPMDRMPVWRAIEGVDEPVVAMPDVAAELGPAVAGALRTGALMSVRLGRPGGPAHLGHLVVSWRAARAFGERDHALALRLASLAAPALASARTHMRTLAALESSERAEAQLNQAQRLAGLGRWAWRATDGTLDWDVRVRSMMGVSPDAQADFDMFLACVHPDDRERVMRECETAARAGEPINLRYRVSHPDGARTVAVLGEVHERHAGGSAVRYVGTAQDITGIIALEDEVRMHARLLDAVEAAVIATDMHRTITHWNRGAEDQFGWTAAEAVGRAADELVVAPEDGDVAGAIMEAVARDGRWQGEFTAMRRDGGRIPLRVNQSLIRNASGEPVGMVGVSVDIAERARMEGELRAARDFLERVTATMSDGLLTVDRGGRITHMNLSAQSVLGWSPGEVVGRTLSHTLQPPAGGGRLQERLRTARGEVRTDDEALAHRDGHAIPVEVRAAPIGRGEPDGEWAVVFSDITERREREARMESDLESLRWGVRMRDALTDGGMLLHAQPIVEVGTGRVVQNELLIRMRDPENGGVMPPGRFLPMAERNGLIGQIDRWVVEQAAGLAGRGHAIQINLSAHSVCERDMPAVVEDAIRAAGADPCLLGIEVTETAIMGNPEVAGAFLTRMRELGCSVALDDFGTGYAGFLYLKRLPVDRLKIDIEFIRDLAVNPASRHVVSAVCRLAADFGQVTIAEGVEDRATLDLLREMGVDCAQGYGICRPGPLASTLGRVGEIDVPSAGWWGAPAPARRRARV